MSQIDRIMVSKIPQRFGCRLLALPTSLPCLTTSESDCRNSEITVVLVPGAWQVPAHYELLQQKFAQAGYDFVVYQDPSCDSQDPNTQTAAKDIAFQRDQVIMPLLGAGRTVVLAAHSYGGLPGSAAAEGLSIAERQAAHRRGGILGLIMINTILPRNGESLLDQLPGRVFDPWVIQKASESLPEKPHASAARIQMKY